MSFASLLRLSALRRRADLDERSAVLALFARFTDEVGSGLLVVLTPTLRDRLGLSIGQVGWCYQALALGGALVEPAAAAAVDLVHRRPLLVAGAGGWAAALLLAAGAPSFGWLVVAFALAGMAYGPLTTTADVVLVEGHPHDTERIVSRSTAIDTVGALLAPVAVLLAGRTGLDDRWLFAVTGVCAALYAGGLATSRLPAPATRVRPDPLAAVRANVRAVVADRRARPWLVALMLLELPDLPEVFEPVWLQEELGVSQGLIALHTTLGMLATFAGLLLLDRWLSTHAAGPVVIACCAATVLLYPAWLLLPGVATRFLLVVPRNLVMAPLWPIVRARALGAVPERAGALSSITSLTNLLPLAAGTGWLAQRIGLTPVLLGIQLIAVLAVALVLVRAARPSPAAR